MLTPEQRKEKLKLVSFSDEALEILTTPGEVGSDDAVRYAINLKNIAKNGPIPPEERKGLQGVEEEIESHLTKTTTAALMASETLGNREVLGDRHEEGGTFPTDGFHVTNRISGEGGPLKWISPARVKWMQNARARLPKENQAAPSRSREKVATKEEVGQSTSPRLEKVTIKRPHGIQKTRRGRYQVIFKLRRVDGARISVHLGNYDTLGEAGRRLNEYLRVENPKQVNPLNWPIFPDEYYDSPEAASFYK